MRDGEGKESGEEVADEAKDFEGGRDAAYCQLHEGEQVSHEENEGEEHASEEGVASDFAEDVASEDAHVRLGISVSRRRRFQVASSKL